MTSQGIGVGSINGSSSGPVFTFDLLATPQSKDLKSKSDRPSSSATTTQKVTRTFTKTPKAPPTKSQPPPSTKSGSSNNLHTRTTRKTRNDPRVAYWSAEAQFVHTL